MIATTTLIALLAAAPNLNPPSSEQAVRRFALITAANDGGPSRVTLRYARSDAESFAEVLGQLGGVDSKDELRVLEPSRAEMEAALEDLHARAERARARSQRVEVLLYYSGHSDTDGLLLGEERFGYGELRRRLDAVPADVRIVVLDSCASGAMTRAKGGRRRPPFAIDASNRVTGSAILTSSSEDEAAQESDQLGGSFFTHYLVSGLRGAGDVTGDGRVTLSEAYQFAFHETLRRTEATLGGPQHPAYAFRLSGSGDVVMTDLRSTSAALHLDEALYGDLFVRRADGQLVVELRKPAGRPVQLGLEPGPYEITLLQDGVQFRGQVELTDGEAEALEPGRLGRHEGEATTLRGSGPHPAQRRVVPFDIGILPILSVNGFAEPTLNHVSLSLGMSYGHDLEGVQLAIGASWMEGKMDGLQAAIGFSHTGGRGSGGQFGVGLASTARDFDGVQAGVGAAFVGGELIGWQSAAGANVAAKSVTGLQSASGLNVAWGPMWGAQFAAGLNVAHDVEGVQMAGGLNVAGDVTGAQVSMLNVARAVRGLQLGVVNVVEETKGVSLGLLSYATKDGILDMKVGSSDVGLVDATLEIGTKYLYTGVSVFAGTWMAPEAIGFGLHLGGRVRPGTGWVVDIESGARSVTPNRDFETMDIIATTKITLGYQLSEAFSLYIGPALHVLVDLHDPGSERSLLAPSYASRPSEDRVYLWPGVAAGVRLF